MADGSFVILCGIPASGKTTFAKELIQMNWQILGKSVHFIYVCYDDFIPENLVASSESLFLEGWKTGRRRTLNGVEELVENGFSTQGISVSKPCACGAGNMRRSCDISHIVVIDDNMYYRSMRYEYYQLARKARFGFAEIILHCPLDVALNRNFARAHPVSKETIIKMTNHIEKPEPGKFPWEKFNMMIDTSSCVTEENWKEILKLLHDSCCNLPPPLMVLNEEQRAKDRSITKQNISHQADQVIRKYISAKLNQLKEHASRDEIKQTAEELNRQRKNVMRNITKDPEQITKNIFIEQFRRSCKIQSFDENATPLPSPHLENKQDIDEEDYSDAGASCRLGDCGSTGLKKSLEDNHDVNELMTAPEMTLAIEHFWEVVTMEDFSDMVKRFFEQYNG